MDRNRKISIHIEDYLENIKGLIDEKGYARVSDIADALDLSRPSVSNMIQRLDKMGLVNYERYRGITLTDQGRQLAIDIQTKHRVLTEFLSMLGLPKDIVYKDVEGIEHHLSSKTLKKLSRLVDFWREHPTRFKEIFPS